MNIEATYNGIDALKEDPPACPSAFLGVDDLKNGGNRFFSHDFEARQTFRVNLGFQRKKAFLPKIASELLPFLVHTGVEISTRFVVFQSAEAHA